MIAGRLGHAPRSRFRMLPLKVLEDYGGVVDVLGSPLRLRQQDPIQRTFEALVQCQRQKRLRMPDKSYLACRQPQPLPDQPHQAIGLRPASRIAVAAGRKDQTDLLQGSGAGWDGARHSIRQAFDEQGMRGVQIVMMQRNLRMLAASFSQSASADRPGLENVQVW